MRINFNSLDRFEKPRMTLCNPGAKYTNGYLTNVVGMITDSEAEEAVFNFNTTSQLNFRVNRIVRDDPDENLFSQKIYRAIQNRRLIFLEDIGFFVITEVTEDYENGYHYKDVSAASIDNELEQKAIPYIADGTYPFSTAGETKGIFEMIMEVLPLWTIGEVSSTVAEKWRTFEDVDTSLNCLSFLLQNIQDAYECIVVFDILNRTVGVYDQNNYVRRTNIHITEDDLVNTLAIQEDANDIYTAINVLGGDNITIAAVNPLGTNTIYDFSYYTDWMTPSLYFVLAG